MPALTRAGNELALEPTQQACPQLVQEVPVGACAVSAYQFVSEHISAEAVPASQGHVSAEAESARELASTSVGSWVESVKLAVLGQAVQAGSVRCGPAALAWSQSGSGSGTAQNLASAAAATWPQSWVGPVRMDTTIV